MNEQQEQQYDIQVEQSVYQGNIEQRENNHYKPFSQGSLRTEKKMESKTNPDYLKKEIEEITKWHKDNKTGLI